MPPEKAGVVIPDMLIISKPEDMRLIFSEKHNRILNRLKENEHTISELSRLLDMNPGSVHYHVKELEKHGLIVPVRDEIKGGVVKKYYRSSARRILLESPDFNRIADLSSIPSPDYLLRVIRSIEYLGYRLSPDKAEEANELLLRYDRRIKNILLELRGSGISEFEENGLVMDAAFYLILNVRAKDDPEIKRLLCEFEKVFIKY